MNNKPLQNKKTTNQTQQQMVKHKHTKSKNWENITASLIIATIIGIGQLLQTTLQITFQILTLIAQR